MNINPEITDILKEFKINKDEGLLCLLGIYFKLDVEKTCSEDTIKAINLTKIVTKDYSLAGHPVKWNIPLFEGQQTEWGWVITEYNAAFHKRNPSRKDNDADVIKRMQEFFRQHPHVRKEDVKKATLAYFATVKDPQYLKSSAKFIFEGIGKNKISHLLTWYEKIKTGDSSSSQMKGNLL